MVDDGAARCVVGATLEVSSGLAGVLNSAAEPSLAPFPRLVPGRHVWLDIGLGPQPAEGFRAAYDRLTVRLDGEVEIRPADHPTLSILETDGGSNRRRGWTWMPATLLPPDWFGRVHDLELLEDGVTIIGPTRQVFHASGSGQIVDHIEDDHGRLIVEIRADSDAAAPLAITFLTDPAFGQPTSVAELDSDGASHPIDWRDLGDAIAGGDRIGHVWRTATFRPRHSRVVLAVRLTRPGRGLALALADGFVRDAALRVDATVL